MESVFLFNSGEVQMWHLVWTTLSFSNIELNSCPYLSEILVTIFPHLFRIQLKFILDFYL